MLVGILGGASHYYFFLKTWQKSLLKSQCFWQKLVKKFHSKGSCRVCLHFFPTAYFVYIFSNFFFGFFLIIYNYHKKEYLGCKSLFTLAMTPEILVQSGESDFQKSHVFLPDFGRNRPRCRDDVANAKKEKQKAQSWNLPRFAFPVEKRERERKNVGGRLISSLIGHSLDLSFALFWTDARGRIPIVDNCLWSASLGRLRTLLKAAASYRGRWRQLFCTFE